METYEEFIQNILNTRGRFACGEEYHERHHILPKCMEGSNDEENLIDLYAREHFIAHKLLALENPNNDKLIFAWNMMSVHIKSNSRYILTPEEYEELRKAVAVAISNTNKGRKDTEEQRKRKSERLKGIPKSEEHKKKLGLSHLGMKHSEQSKQKMSERQRGSKSPVAKEIIQYDLDCNYIQNWGCIEDASNALGISSGGIGRCCRKDKWYKQSGGSIWRYADDPLTDEEIAKIKADRQRIRGVYQEKRNGKWYVKIGNKHIGTFATKEEAIFARLRAEEEKNINGV